MKEKRQLKINFLAPGDVIPRATVTFRDRIPEEEFREIAKWALKGEGKYAKTRFGTIRKTLTVNVLITRGV